MRHAVALALLAALPLPSSAAVEAAAAVRSPAVLHRSVARASAALRSARLTGDPDHDFMAAMESHFRHRIELADLEAIEGGDSETRGLAMGIQRSKTEMKRIQRWLYRRVPAPGTRDSRRRFSATLRHGADAFGLLQPSKSFDRDFARALIIHNRNGIALADQLLRDGKDEAARVFARDLIESHVREVSLLEDWLSRQK